MELNLVVLVCFLKSFFLCNQASPTVSLVLHINGTYRAHWADRLGFCKTGCAPLAFNCIKSGGGAVPCTFVGIQRIYPVLYRERLSDGEYTVRSERMEAKMQQFYNQRRLPQGKTKSSTGTKRMNHTTTLLSMSFLMKDGMMLLLIIQGSLLCPFRTDGTACLYYKTSSLQAT
ncbi:hypothetical protein POM88_026011 [Heracleum sosnowskyi]|uniref:Uncharacterized protein n=1 Tax=Heracleum sosnowskyi TaxID=360622 RepID=A0AAD8I4Z7_9APIA|nr:hypothetical protein POM88_026011 [Heracleum sosnowskyi]